MLNFFYWIISKTIKDNSKFSNKQKSSQHFISLNFVLFNGFVDSFNVEFYFLELSAPIWNNDINSINLTSHFRLPILCNSFDNKWPYTYRSKCKYIFSGFQCGLDWNKNGFFETWDMLNMAHFLFVSILNDEHSFSNDFNFNTSNISLFMPIRLIHLYEITAFFNS